MLTIVTDSFLYPPIVFLLVIPMGITSDLKAGLQVMLHPGDNTKKPMEVGEAYSWYFKVTLIPLVALIIVALILTSAFTSSPIYSLIGLHLFGIGIASAIIVPLLFVWVLIPVGILISAGLYHIVGTWSGVFKGDFNKTLTATMFSKMPTTIFLFTAIVPAAAAFYLLFAVWELVVLLLALANQQKVKWQTALGIVVMTVVIVAVVIGVVVTVFAVTFNNAIVNAVLPHILGNNGFNQTITGLPVR